MSKTPKINGPRAQFNFVYLAVDQIYKETPIHLELELFAFLWYNFVISRLVIRLKIK